jgi:ATP-binding cassette subfamily B protein
MGGGMGMGGPGMRRGLNMAPEELEEAIAKLPPVIDTPVVDIVHETRDHKGFQLLQFVKPYWRTLTFGLVLVTVNTLMALAGPYLIRWGIDHGVVDVDKRNLFMAAGAFIAVTLLARVVGYFSSIYTSKIGQRFLFALRVRVFAQLQRLGLDFYDQEMSGRIMTRMTSDITAMNGLLQSGLIQSLVLITQFLGTIVIMFTMNWRLAMFVLMIVPPLAAATIVYRSRSSSAYLRVREGVAAVNANFQESISGIRVAQAFGREGRNMNTYREVTGEYMDARLSSQRISSFYFPFVELMSVLANVFVLGFGSRYIADGTLTPGGLIAFNLYVTTVFAPIQQMSNLFDTYQQARAAVTKLRELLTTSTSIPEADEPVKPARLRGEITFDNVHFEYATANREALKGATFRINSGETVALVGETGAGKSTTIKLLARFYDPTAGQISIDDVPLRDLDIENYRKQLGYVPQEPFLFSGTIHDNIAYGKPGATREEVEQAAAAVGADSFIEAMPEGYDQPVTERGRSLSAGQRQLIALARALLVDPVILLLDEATANLDLATEAQVNRAMGVVSAGRTTVLIAHRLPTAHRADRILVVDDGRIVEEGRPDDLLVADRHYAALWRTYNAEEKQPA